MKLDLGELLTNFDKKKIIIVVLGCCVLLYFDLAFVF